ncbi:MAG: pyridoxine 5-phosphate synthase [Acidobacteriota bacterium]|jgi:pyridoxine 5-phosphate synthase
MTTGGRPKLSVNVNKVATLRNSRGGQVPSVLDAVHVVIEAGAAGITVHPRADARHITAQDVRDIARVLAPLRGRIEFNIEGDPRPDLVALVLEVRPDQCTLVPVFPGEVTSQAGWPPDTPVQQLSATVRQLQSAGVRVSLFVDPEESAVLWASRIGGDRVELYTEPFARAFAKGGEAASQSFTRYTAAARVATAAGLGINAGHDLDLENLRLFRTLPDLAEVSIGHALISRALFVGLDRAVRDYVAAVSGS